MFSLTNGPWRRRSSRSPQLWARERGPSGSEEAVWAIASPFEARPTANNLFTRDNPPYKADSDFPVFRYGFSERFVSAREREFLWHVVYSQVYLKSSVIWSSVKRTLFFPANAERSFSSSLLMRLPTCSKRLGVLARKSLRQSSSSCCVSVSFLSAVGRIGRLFRCWALRTEIIHFAKIFLILPY